MLLFGKLDYLIDSIGCTAPVVRLPGLCFGGQNKSLWGLDIPMEFLGTTCKVTATP